MNSVMAAQKVWNSFTNRRYCPTEEELAEAVAKITKNEPAFVGRNALRRLKGHLQVLIAIIAYEPKNEEETSIRERDLNDIGRRSFEQEFCFPPDKPHYYR